ncbi:hypothetical protein V7122_25650 [Bacillus sp. JJ1532]|uniref:hypothetical protein n=1 Tax=Bacillus sp. JJ1532 TaxID=3122958 RepID=UPI002FFD81AA
MNLQLAKKRIAELQNFVDLTESYESNTFEQHVIKEYAIAGSMQKVKWKMKELGHDVDMKVISEIIKGKPNDELHKIVREFHKAKSPRKFSDIW